MTLADTRGLSDQLSFLVLPVLINDAIAELAGNDHTRWDEFLGRVGEFHGRWRSFFVERASRGAFLNTADHSQFPRFEPSNAGAIWLGAGMGQVVAAMAWVSAIATVLLVWSSIRMSRAA